MRWKWGFWLWRWRWWRRASWISPCPLPFLGYFSLFLIFHGHFNMFGLYFPSVRGPGKDVSTRLRWIWGLSIIVSGSNRTGQGLWIDHTERYPRSWNHGSGTFFPQNELQSLEPLVFSFPTLGEPQGFGLTLLTYVYHLRTNSNIRRLYDEMLGVCPE